MDEEILKDGQRGAGLALSDVLQYILYNNTICVWVWIDTVLKNTITGCIYISQNVPFWMNWYIYELQISSHLEMWAPVQESVCADSIHLFYVIMFMYFFYVTDDWLFAWLKSV